MPIFSHDNMMVNEFLEVGGDAVEGFITMTGADPNLDLDKYQEFPQRLYWKNRQRNWYDYLKLLRPGLHVGRST